jgi:hypothetical protein
LSWRFDDDGGALGTWEKRKVRGSGISWKKEGGA